MKSKLKTGDTVKIEGTDMIYIFTGYLNHKMTLCIVEDLSGNKTQLSTTLINQQMKTLNIHPSKVWDIIYPIYAKEFWQCNKYEEFVRCVQNDFNLTPEQWGSLLTQWELREYITQPK